MAKVVRMFEVVPKSGMIHKLGYDPLSQFLVVQFTNFDVWSYQNVEPLTYARLLNAPSVGAFFTDHIRAFGEVHKPKKLSAERDKAAAHASKKPNDEAPLLDVLEASVNRKKK